MLNTDESPARQTDRLTAGLAAAGGLAVLAPLAAGGLAVAAAPWAAPLFGWVGAGLVGAAVGRRFAARRPAQVDPDALHAQRLSTVGVLAGGVAHDLNNVLNVVIGHAELAAGAAAGTVAGGHATRAVTAAGRCVDLTRQLLTIAGKTPPVTGLVRVPDLVRETVDLVAAGVPKAVRFAVDVPGDLPSVVGDGTQLRQVVLNLVLNAAEAVGRLPGTVAVRAESRHVALAGAPPGPAVRLEVADTGAGMDPATAAKMFDPFFTTKPAGRGLGLSAVRGIVDAHRGTIRVVSEPGVGTTVTVWLPAAPAAAPDTSDLKAAAKPTPPADPHGRPVALVVDDDDALRTLAEEQLVRLGWDVLTAGTGPDAVDLLRAAADRVRLVLLDLDLPEQSGADTLTALRRVKPGVPVLVCTGSPEDSAADAADAGGANGVLLKPYRGADLAAAVAHATNPAGAASSMAFGR